MNRIKLTLLLIISLFALTICKKMPTPPQSPQPGSRNYTWKLDTLDMPMNYISSVWGAAPNDVWAVGAGGTEYDRLLHYDGETWSTYENEPINCSAYNLFGFSANDIWMGGGGGWGNKGAGIWHYDGTQWSQNYIYYVEGAYDVQVTHIWGTAPNDVYACGHIGYHEEGKTDFWRGFVLHYDGGYWKEVVQAQSNSQFLKIRKNQTRIIVQSFSYEIGAVDVIGFYRVKDNALEKLHSTNLDTAYWASLHVINNKTYFVIGEDVYEYLRSGKMVKRLSFPQPEFECQIYGRNETDLFIAMKDGIAHYNGVNTQYLYKFPVAQMGNINDPMIFKNDIFFCVLNLSGSYNTTNLMLHGTLPKLGD